MQQGINLFLVKQILIAGRKTEIIHRFFWQSNNQGSEKENTDKIVKLYYVFLMGHMQKDYLLYSKQCN